MANATGQAIDYDASTDADGSTVVNINGSAFSLDTTNVNTLAQQEYDSLINQGTDDSDGTLLSSITSHYQALASAASNNPIAYSTDGPPIPGSGGSGSNYSAPLPTSSGSTSTSILQDLFGSLGNSDNASVGLQALAGNQVQSIAADGSITYAPSPGGSFLQNITQEVADDFHTTVTVVTVVAVLAGLYFISRIAK